MFRTTNPVLSRKDAFVPAGGQPQGQGYAQYGQQQFGQQQYDQSQYGQQQYGQAQYGHYDDQFGQRPPGGTQGLMTLPDVITKASITLAVVALTAAAMFLLLPNSLLLPLAIVASIGTIVITFIVAFRRTIPAPLVMVFAVLEGAMVGGISKVFESYYPGIVVQAVLGTLVAAGATLIAYRFFNLRIGARAMKILGIATLSFAVVMLVNFVCGLAGIDLGLRAGVTGPVGWLPWLVSALAIVLCVFNLVSDFQFIEHGVEIGASSDQSWKAAFGLTATLVWLYVEMLRVISYIRR